MNKSRRFFFSSFENIPGTVFFVLTAIFVWGAQKGFDIMDEGLYYASFNDPSATYASNSEGYQFYGRVAYRLFSGSIVAHRLLTFSLTVMVSAFLWLTIYKLGGMEKKTSLFFILIYTFLEFTLGPVALSYNFQSALCLCLAACLLVQNYFSAKIENSMYGIFVGIGAGLAFFSKWPVALVILGLSLMAPILTRGIVKPLMRQVLAVSLGVGLVLALHFWLFQPAHDWWAAFKLTLNTNLASGYEIPGMLMRYALEISDLLKQTSIGIGWSLGIMISGTLIIRKFADRVTSDKRIGHLFLGSAFVLILEQLTNLRSSIQYRQIAQFNLGLILWFFVAAFTYLHGRKKIRAHLKTFGLAGLFLFLPFLGALGTDNHIYENALFLAATWAGTILLLNSLLGAELKLSAGLVLTLAIVGTSIHFCRFYLVHPGPIGGSRFAQTEPVSLGPDHSHVLVTPQIKNFLNEIRTVLDERRVLADKKPILAIYNMPGIIFALNGGILGTCWYFSGQVNLPRNRIVFSHLRREEIQNAVVIEQNLGHPEWVADLFESVGLAFPKGYDLLKELDSPYTGKKVRIWFPQVHPDKSF